MLGDGVSGICFSLYKSQYLEGAFDDTKIEVNMTRLAVGAGGWYRLGGAAALTGELYSVPSDATTVRLGGAYTFR